jgi:hypothetical protein
MQHKQYDLTNALSWALFASRVIPAGRGASYLTSLARRSRTGRSPYRSKRSAHIPSDQRSLPSRHTRTANHVRPPERPDWVSTLIYPRNLQVQGWRSPVSLSLPAALAFFLLYGVLSVPRLWHADGGVGFLAASIVLALPLVMLSAVDLRQYRLPDALTLPLIVVGLLLGAWSGVSQVCWSALSAGLGFSLLAGIAYVYRRVRGRAGLGLGDAKVLAASGAWLGGKSCRRSCSGQQGSRFSASFLPTGAGISCRAKPPALWPVPGTGNVARVALWTYNANLLAVGSPAQTLRLGDTSWGSAADSLHRLAFRRRRERTDAGSRWSAADRARYPRPARRVHPGGDRISAGRDGDGQIQIAAIAGALDLYALDVGGIRHRRLASPPSFNPVGCRAGVAVPQEIRRAHRPLGPSYRYRFLGGRRLRSLPRPGQAVGGTRGPGCDR